jgi:hypothetical protein
MSQVSDKIRAFFEDFNRANNAFDPNFLAPHVRDPLVGADPNGVTQVISKADYLAGTAKSQAYLQSLGFQFVKAIPVEEFPLSEHYTLVKTKGTMRLEKTPGSQSTWPMMLLTFCSSKMGNLRLSLSFPTRIP